MSSVNRSVCPAKGKSAVQRNARAGKENALPKGFSSATLRSQGKGEEAIPKKRLHLNSEGRTADPRSCSFAAPKFPDFPSRKARFRVHCDEKLTKESAPAVSTVESKTVSQTGEGKTEEGTVSKVDAREPQVGKNIPRKTKIPMRIGRPRRTDARGSVGVEGAKGEQRLAASSRGKRACSLPALRRNESMGYRSAIVSLSREVERIKLMKEDNKAMVIESKIPKIKPLRSIDPNETKGTAETNQNFGRTITDASLHTGNNLTVQFKQTKPQGNVITPIDGPAPLPLLPIKAMIRHTKHEAENAAERPGRCTDLRAVDPFPSWRAFHMEYQEDLPVVEWERQTRAPTLSDDFLKMNINPRQRREIVVYLIHLSSHCRYPSYIIYQAVKMFDAVMDRLPVETLYLQLTALAVLWICLKRQENYYKIPSATTMVALAGELYIGREDLLIRYERKVLKTLDFNITFADAHSTLAYFLKNCDDRFGIPEGMSSFIYSCAAYMIDLTLLDESLYRASASLVAIAAAELALSFADFIGDRSIVRWRFWRALLATALPTHLRFQDKDIVELRLIMTKNILFSGEKRSGFEVVYKKYNRSKYGRISPKVVQCAEKISAAEKV